MMTRTIIEELGHRGLSTVFILALVGRGAAAAPAPTPIAPPVPAGTPASAGTSAPVRSTSVPPPVVIDAVRAPSGSDLHNQLTRALAATAGPVLPASAAGCASVDCLPRVAANRRADQVILLTGAPNSDEGYDLRVECWTPAGVRQSQGTCNFCTAADTAALAGRLISAISVPIPALVPVPTSAAAPSPAAAPVRAPVAGQTQLVPNGSAAGPASPRIVTPPVPPPSPEPAFRPAPTDRDGTGRTLGVVLLAGAAAAGAAGGVLLLLDGSETGCTEFTTGRVCDGQRSTAAPGLVALGFGVALAVAGGVVLYESAGGDRLATVTVGPGNIHLKGRF